jgi:hypothetical protein
MLGILFVRQMLSWFCCGCLSAEAETCIHAWRTRLATDVGNYRPIRGEVFAL